MKAIIILDDVPDWQTGEEVTVFFPDTMCKRGKCIAVLDDEGYRDAKRIFERPQGEWIDNGQGFHFCKSCGYFALYQTHDTKTYFEKLSDCCPHCGAKMKEV